MTGSDIALTNGTLTALPTRDATLPILGDGLLWRCNPLFHLPLVQGEKEKGSANNFESSHYPILANLFAATNQGISLSVLWDRLPARFGRAGLIDDFPMAASQTILANLIPTGDIIEVEFDSAGGVIDCSRADAIPAPLAAGLAADWQQVKPTLTRFFTPAIWIRRYRAHQCPRRRACLLQLWRHRAHTAVGQRGPVAHLCE